MAEKTFSERFIKARKAAGFTVADMAVWFGKSFWTVRQWEVLSATPFDDKLRVEESLVRLEKALEAWRGEWLPPPEAFRGKERRAYIAQCRKDAKVL